MPAGYALLDPVDATGNSTAFIWCYAKVLGAGEGGTNHVWAWASTTATAACLILRGCDPGRVLDVPDPPAGVTANTTTVFAPATTVATAGSWALWGCALATSATMAWPATLNGNTITRELGSASGGLGVAWATYPAAGAVAACQITQGVTGRSIAKTLVARMLPNYKNLTGGASGVALVNEVLSKKVGLVGDAGGVATATGAIDKYSALIYKDVAGIAAGRGQVGTAFLWGTGNYGGSVWAGTGATVVTGGPPVAGDKYITGAAAGASAAAAAPTRRRALAAGAVGRATTTAAPGRRRALSGAATGAGAAAGALRARRVLAGAATGRATALGFVDKAGSVFRPLFASSAGRATTVALVTGRRALFAGGAGVAATAAEPTRRRALVAGAAGGAVASGAIDVAAAPFVGVVWAGDHFEPGTGDALVRWDTVRFQTEGEYARVVWDADAERFEVGV